MLHVGLMEAALERSRDGGTGARVEGPVLRAVRMPLLEHAAFCNALRYRSAGASQSVRSLRWARC